MFPGTESGAALGKHFRAWNVCAGRVAPFLSNARHSGRMAHEINPPLDRHEADGGLVLRRERLDVFSAVIVRYSERILFALGREQDACLGEGARLIPRSLWCRRRRTALA
jgi:hypothetical protein